jgi:hypothetical protein
MDLFDDDEIPRVLRLKRYEQPPPGYFENFISEFHRRQRDELLREPLWSTCVDRARDFVFRHNIRPLACYSAAIVAVIVCAAVISIALYQQPDATQLAVQGSPLPTFEMQPTLSPGSRVVPVLPVNSLYSAQFIPLELESESLDDQFSLER